MRILLLIALLTSVTFSSVWAKIYSCRDSSGRMHFSDNLRKGRQELLLELEQSKLSSADKGAVRSLLDGIAAE